MSGFTIACILGNNSSSSIKNNLKRKISDDNNNEHQLHKRQTIEVSSPVLPLPNNNNENCNNE